ncbi:MAG: carboxylesterase/lipase family protein [Dehalococcoidales bacterium]|nr:carboxylesterase/lipase family protein [Dehalococcoidales bacterium]
MAEPIVEITNGKVQGTTEDGIHVFKGIPYGAPTSGKNRFMPPQPAKPWAGIRDATRYGNACWQPSEGNVRMGYWGANGVDSMSEDCLFLNVWTKGLKDNGKRPVMVWIHGGGYRTGSANQAPFYNGAMLAKTYDVVVVSVNHRLNVFGYLYLAEIFGERYAASGNNGMLDLVEALKWVRDNIAQFGGNPGNVLIFGESGGGAKVSTLLAMPSAKGLFHRAVIQSGPSLRSQNPEDATRNAREFLDVVRITPERINQLHDNRADNIFYAYMAMSRSADRAGAEMGPVCDGKIIPVHPFDPVAAPTAANVPVIVGCNRDETAFMLMRDPLFGKFDEATMRQRVIATLAQRTSSKAVADMADNLIAGYRRTRPGATPHDILVAVGSDRMRIASIRLAERKAAGGVPAYMYLFTWESLAWRGRLKSAHSFEIPFVFNYMHDPTVTFLGDKPERFKLAETMSGAWTTFAKSGDPNHKGMIKWPTYDKEKRATVIFNTECRIENDPFSEERKLWDGII